MKLNILLIDLTEFIVNFRLLFDDRILNILPISVYLSTKFWMYVTWFTWLFPCILLVFISFEISII